MYLWPEETLSCSPTETSYFHVRIQPKATDPLAMAIGLDWIGNLFYPREAFSHEATSQGTRTTVQTIIIHTHTQHITQSNQFVNWSAVLVGECHFFPLLLEARPCHPISFDLQSSIIPCASRPPAPPNACDWHPFPHKLAVSTSS